MRKKKKSKKTKAKKECNENQKKWIAYLLYHKGDEEESLWVEIMIFLLGFRSSAESKKVFGGKSSGMVITLDGKGLGFVELRVEKERALGF